MIVLPVKEDGDAVVSRYGQVAAFRIYGATGRHTGIAVIITRVQNVERLRPAMRELGDGFVVAEYPHVAATIGADAFDGHEAGEYSGAGELRVRVDQRGIRRCIGHV
jgi:hypothetical protein